MWSLLEVQKRKLKLLDTNKVKDLSQVAKNALK
jgi:hypothetical protein